MFTMLVLLVLLIAFDIAAMHWGHNSSDSIENEEWERRQHYAWYS